MKKIGRNDFCPCGSGKKFKHCCGSVQSDTFSIASTQPSGISPDVLQVGLAHHLAGRLPQAEAAYRQILQVMPDHPDALYLSGLIAHESGKSEAAIELIERAIRINPVGPFYHTLGNVHHKLGRLDEAVRSFRKALELVPDMAEAHIGLGNTLKALGKLEEATRSYRNALRSNQNLVEAHLNLGNVFRAQSKLDEAIKHFRTAIKLKPDYAEAYNNLGSALHECGNLDEAVKQFRKALELKPDMAGAHNNLGNALQSQGKFDEAIDSFERALMLKPDYAEAGNNLGNVFKEQNKLDAAITCYREVLKFNPLMVEAYSGLGRALHEQGEQEDAAESLLKALKLEPDCISAHLGLAAVYQDIGRFDKAKIHCDHVFALKPEHPGAWAALAALRKMTLDDLPWAETAQRILEGRLKPETEMGLCYALGKYYDDTHQYEAAFGHYRRANYLKRERAGSFERDEFRLLIDKIIAEHPIGAVRQRYAGSSDSLRPLFIVGMPRSGTSLTEQILASHPDVFGAGELRFWGKQFQEHRSKISSDNQDAALRQEIADRYETELQRRSVTALRVVDKMPGNFLYLGLIHTVYPQARILHTQRNPIDTCLSIYFQAFDDRHLYATDLDDLAFYYREYHRLMAHWRMALPPEVFMDVPYEALIEDQEGWSRRIIDFIGLEWDERCLNFHKTERKVGTASNWQVRQKIYKTSKERWRNYKKFVDPLLPLLDLY